jgi:hypothetical protein
MSYNILEQAIIDAKSLREAALKNAETTVLEKYAEEVRGAIDLMLEEEVETLEEHEMMTPEAEIAEPALAAAEGEELCGCPDTEDDVEWELSLDDLRAMSDSMPEGEPMGDPAAEEEEEMFLQESEELDEEIDLVFEDEEKEKDEDEPSGEAGSSRKRSMRDRYSSQKSPRALEEKELEEAKQFAGDDKIDGDKDGKPKWADSDDPANKEDELDEEMVREIVEELVVDIKPTKRGWAGTPTSDVRRAEEQELARLAGTEAREEHEAVKSAMEELSESKKVSETENQKLKQLIYDLKGKLDESILSNAKLLYTNQTLRSASLNERQKNRIVESIHNADSVEEAKVIYETLQSAAGPSTRKSPKSLSEVISRPSLHLSRRRDENPRRESVVKNRFQALAGIKNK